MDLEGADGSNDLPSNLRVHLDGSMVRDWRVFRSVAEYCNGQITATTQIISRKRILSELRGLNAQMYSARIATTSDEREGSLQVMPSLDIDFL